MELEVRGLTDDVDTDYLVLYLENTLRSGGGPVSSYTRSGSQALVTFENLSDAEHVLSKEAHRVQSVTLHIRRPPPWDPGKVALCGLHPETEEPLLELYVERVSGREAFTMVRSSDRRSVLVTFQEPLSEGEVGDLERNVQRRSLSGSSLSVQRVRLCAEVLVENLGGNVSAELLEMYFESRRSGGGKVTSLTMIRNGAAAIVSFSDVNVATQVLGRSHLLQNCQLSVSPYYPDLMGSPSAEETGPPEEPHRSPTGSDPIIAEPCEVRARGPAGSDPIIAEPWEVQARGPAGSDHDKPSTGEVQARGPAGSDHDQQSTGEAENSDEVTQAAPPALSLQDMEMSESPDAGTSPKETQEEEILMDSSELRFMQEYHHELLAGMDQVTIVPLEAEDKCGFKVAGDPVSCRTAVELLLHIVSSLSSRTVTLQYPGVSLFLLEDEGRGTVLETERQHQCIIDTSHLSWKVMGCKPVDPWSYVSISDPSSVPSIIFEELSEAAGSHRATDMEDIKVFASLLKNSQTEDQEDLSAPTPEWNIRPINDEVDLYTDTPARSQDDGPSEAADEELEQVYKMSRDEFQDRQLDEEAQLLLAIQMSMDTQDTSLEDEDKDLERALALSLREQALEEVEEPLQRALEMSLRTSWARDETSPGQEDVDEVSGDDLGKALDTAQIKVLAGDETSLVVACAAIRKAVTGRLCTVTLDGTQDFQHKTQILSALEKKHKVTILENEGQAQIHGFLQNPLKCQEELSQILSALRAGSRLQALDPQQKVLLIPVSDTSEEYNTVVQQFLSTLKNLRSLTQVLQVQKVQNTLLYNQYQLKKQSMRAQSPGAPIERTLYHGTTENGAKEICHRGFNRSFSGRNATLFGHGVYFAVEATISARDRYSPPSSDGHKYILVAHVLTGEFALGKEDMRMPPVKPDSGDVPQRYDSLADNLQNPSIFVIFNDTQAYPQYLITCCSTSDGGK